MAGTPKMQEHFSAGASTPSIPKNEDLLDMRRLACPPRMQEQFSAGALTSSIPKNGGLLDMYRLTGTPEMQEQFPAGAWKGRHPENEGTLSADAFAHPRIQLTSFPRKRESILICAFRHLKEEQHGFPLSRE